MLNWNPGSKPYWFPMCMHPWLDLGVEVFWVYPIVPGGGGAVLQAASTACQTQHYYLAERSPFLLLPQWWWKFLLHGGARSLPGAGSKVRRWVILPSAILSRELCHFFSLQGSCYGPCSAHWPLLQALLPSLGLQV